MQSPLTNKTNISLVASIKTENIVYKYKKELNIDVSRFFKKLEKISLFKCNDTNYYFFHPNNISGDSMFYEALQQFDWYYMPWKWEHEISMSIIKKESKILEVGSGGLGFAEKLTKNGYDITGLELNTNSIKLAKEKNINILAETIQQHAKTKNNTYDIACSYQVLEHIYDVHSFIESQIKCLKKGGKLIICVPNNGSFIKHSNNNNILNMPPHHMGLWTKDSLKKLSSIFNIKLENIFYEPLQEYHLQWYLNTFKNKITKYKILHRIYNKINGSKIIEYLMQKKVLKIKGHSILAVYCKL